ncbi:MAG: hypothetical protein IKQ49_00705 [Eubacterium sp.]|nr:hypothetical protein [Eubacterium sp.]MBR6171685.1 hypothetical protein [Eubacterium sp.]
MKKRSAVLLLCLMVCFWASACGSKDEATTTGASSGVTEQGSTEATITLQEEILSFVGQELPAIEAERNEAVSLYNSYYTENGEKDSDKWMTILSDKALPKYDSYLKKLNDIPVVHDDVAELKKLYVESADLQRAAIEDVINAIKNVDVSLLEYAQNKVDESHVKLQEYETKLRNLCKANNINLEGNVTPTTEAVTEATEQAATEAP